MNKYILAAIIIGDESVAFGFVKPFDSTCCHGNYLIKK
jgi:hypothetical protein